MCNGEDFGVEMWCYYMASSKASILFQHLVFECPSLPQKLQGSFDFFVVLEEDSPDREDSVGGEVDLDIDLTAEGAWRDSHYLMKKVS